MRTPRHDIGQFLLPKLGCEINSDKYCVRAIRDGNLKFLLNGRGRLTQEIVRSEILDWWSAERGVVYAECLREREVLHRRLDKAVEGLSLKELTSPWSPGCATIKRQVESDLNMLGRRLARKVQLSAERSQYQLGDAPSRAAAVGDYAELAASGAAAVGALGLAATAASFATSTATVMFFVPVTTFSWPLFAVAGVSAVGLAFLSPRKMEWTRKKMRQRFATRLKNSIDKSLLGADQDLNASSLCGNLLAQLDTVKDQRLKELP